MAMLGNPRKTLREAIKDSFSRSDLKMALGSSEPRRDWETLVSSSADFNGQVYDLVDRAIREGWIGQLVAILLEERRGKPAFIKKVQPIADMIAAGQELFPEETPGGYIPLHGKLIWGVLALVILGLLAPAEHLWGGLPVWHLLLLILGLVFLILAAATFVPPVEHLLLGFYSTDQRLIPGLGLSGLALTIAAVTSAVLTLPLILRELSPIPSADKDAALSLLVTRLEGDGDGKQTQYVRRSLEDRLIEGNTSDNVSDAKVQILEVRRTLSRSSSDDSNQQIEDAQATGRKWLKQSGADVLIWGEVIVKDQGLRIRFLPKGTRQGYSLSYVLSQSLGSDRSGVIAAQAVAAASPSEQKGTAFGDLLEKASKRLRDLASNPSALDPEEACEIGLAQGDIALTFGQERKLDRKLAEAIEIYTGLKKNCLSDSYFRARRDNRLGIAHAILGERAESATFFRKAIAAFNDSLKNFPDGKPLEQGATQNNLGLALGQLAELENDTARYNEAKTAFQKALELGKRNPDAFDPAPMQNNLGNVLVALGRRERDPASIRQAVRAYCAALKSWKLKSAPRNWAIAQNNLCWTLSNLADIQNDGDQLKNVNLAVCSCLNALQVWHPDNPNWPLAQDNLGFALTKRGELENDTASLRQAVAAHRCAITKWTRGDQPKSWTGAKYNLGKALVALGERTEDTNLLEQALTAFHDASSISGIGDEDVAENRAGIGDAAASLGRREADIAYLHDAATAYGSALTYYQSQSSPKGNDERDALEKKLAEVDSLIDKQNAGGGAQSSPHTGEPSLPQPSTLDSPNCAFSQSGCEDPCIALGRDSTGN